MKSLNKNILILSVSGSYCIQKSLIFDVLKPLFNILKSTTIKQYETQLKKGGIDCVLICSDINNKSIVKAFLRNVHSVPHIIISKEDSKAEVEAFLYKGVKDYIITSNISRLLPAVNREIEAFYDRKKVKQTIEKLKLSEEIVELHLNNAPLATISWDLDFRVTFWNKAAENVFGYTAKEALGKSCLELTVPKGLEKKSLDIFNELVLQKGTAENVNKTLTKSGEVIICHWHNTILENSKGEAIGIISSVEDITEQEHAKKELIKNQRLLQNAQKLSEVYFIDISLDTNKVVLDKEFINLSGLPYEKHYNPEYLLKTLIYRDDKIRILREVNRAIKNKSKLAVDTRVIYADGTIRWVNILADILVDKKTHSKSLVGTFIDVTERKQELFELEKQRQKLNLTIDIADVGFLEWDFETNTLEVSGKTKDIFELDKNRDVFDMSEIISRVHPEDKDKVEKSLNQTKTKSVPYQINHRLALPSGSIIWVNNLGEIIYDKNDKPAKLLGIFRDVTHQINRERRLLQHSLILNQISSLVMVLDKKGDFIFVSPSVKDLTGYLISEVLGQGWWNLSYISDEEKVDSKNYFLSILDETRKVNSLRYERKVKCKNGEIKWFSWQFSKGAENTIIGLAQDVTEEKEKEFLVTKLFKAIEKSPTIVVITDVNGNIEFVNSKFEEVTGYSKHEVIGSNPRILKTGYTSKKEYERLWKTILSGETWHGEFKNKKKDGTVFWEKTVITPVKNSEGIITSFIALKEDITEKKAQEKNFLYALFEAQENEKLKFGEELHDSLSQILSAMSFYLDAVLNPKNNKDRLKVEYLEKVKQLSADALRESRHISHGLMSKQLLKGGLVAAVNEICTNYNVSRDIRFTFSHEGFEEGSLNAQTKQNIYRIIQEITTNIVRHAAASKASIKFSVKNIEWFILEIEDNGIGINPKVVKEKAKSFGLKNIQQRVSLLNGIIERKSKPNKGTKYYIRIPITLEVVNIKSN
jgi:PAS domain S-box-containing protein